jgi:hypothetical protein
MTRVLATANPFIGWQNNLRREIGTRKSVRARGNPGLSKVFKIRRENGGEK